MADVALYALLGFALVGWGIAGVLAVLQYRHVCEVEAPTYAVLLNAGGLAESVRRLRGPAPKTYHRSHGRGQASPYQRKGVAVVYQA